MTVYDHWVPLHCVHCMAYTGHEEWYERPCPEECDCGHSSHASSFVCPVCGARTMAIPPEDWDGSLLYREERPLPMPPIEYGMDDLSRKFTGPAWEQRLADRQRWLGHEEAAP